MSDIDSVNKGFAVSPQANPSLSPNNSISNNKPYVGRFAPSPSGPLHFGSLIAALGSYLRARAEQGQWLVRIEDIDPPREVAGASTLILKTLEAYGLHWDGAVLYQSTRLEAYQARLNSLLAQDKAYYCQCTRKQIQAMGGTYDGRCAVRTPKHDSGAIRIHNTQAIARFHDELQGDIEVEPEFAAEDFIIKRRDGLYAYQLAVVMDDALQGITEVVRGADLLTSSARQATLFSLFGESMPKWLHLPLACAQPGMKLSKQNHAPAIDLKSPQASINAALAFLGQAPCTPDRVETMLAQAVSQFDLSRIPRQQEIILPPGT
ncbi:tRNA glutamyl-Q(34) synthetase GluQRS [Shewanella insulae]|uniref:tRNA glutamyl-Q(34) synthetase GluQRS n=1 Tax=Shewanella insulae TaxID=2681496 RepID=UPI001EFC83D1|nr:tRNA glutamyl-Q(34) synthetase GluQRS [Shewanella insulae]MCG9737992.1 tRNA glutamyl-Q(34) synthetase GluQRS [Shewanella insulae]